MQEKMKNCRKYATKVQNTCICQKKVVILQAKLFEYECTFFEFT